MKEAILYQKKNNQEVECRLCRRFCQIAPGQKGFCQVRQNINGTLYSLNYGKIIAKQVDPIEKKPFYHFLPGTFSYSLAAAGCNFRCRHCQNAEISQINPEIEKINQSLTKTSPEEIVNQALKNKCPSLAYTYTEPTIFAEFALETMKLAKRKNLKNLWVSNGYFSPECLELISPFLDAANIDLKFFQEESYQKICSAQLQPVLDSLIQLNRKKIHLELTTLIIPEINDSDWELKKIADFIAAELGSNTPWHISAFRPAYQMADHPPTPTNSLEKAEKIARAAGLKHCYLGNI